MINPAKYYNPKLIPPGEPVLCLIFVLSWVEGYVSECCDGLFSGIKMISHLSKVMRMEIELYFLT